jgi:hypothetical protein
MRFGVRPDESTSAHPTLWLLGMLIRFVGVPFCIVSTTAPLLQNWLSKTSAASGRDPYFLYGVSNAGSLLALIAYPLLIEPRLGVRVQTSSWAVAYGALLVLVLIAAIVVWKNLSAAALHESRGQSHTAATAGQRFFWLAAAFVPSGLMA